MARRCSITGTGVQAGNNVSHSQRKTRRRFLPNVHKTSLYSEALGRMVRLKLSAGGIRTIEHKGGLDAYLTATADKKLTDEAIRLKKQIARARAAATAG